MTKSPADKIKEAAAGETHPKALSEAAETSGPGQGEVYVPTAKGDGKAPYKDDMQAIYARLDAQDAKIATLEAQIARLTA